MTDLDEKAIEDVLVEIAKEKKKANKPCYLVIDQDWIERNRGKLWALWWLRQWEGK